ncbi:MAG: CHAT domain-containing protein [Cyanobacteria bacterium K_Offshore_surface_m2_239]|nr:CHAT domain-containing protein [Cyanobacteria bacterium K_Offshore_surface_m2_239]
MEEATALEACRQRLRRGAYGQAIQALAALPPGLLQAPRVALARTRAHLLQGRIADAESALTSADLQRASAGERLILSLEAASVRMMRHVAIQAALESAEAALAVARDQPLDPVDRAEADRVWCRLLLTAAVYREVPPEATAAVGDRLLACAEILEQAGRLDEALAARFSQADNLPDMAQKPEALAALADKAIQLGIPSVAGEAQRTRAEKLLALGASSEAIQAALDQAAEFYTRAQHEHGLIDIQLVRAKLASERELAGPESLAHCLGLYRQIDTPKGSLNALMELSQLAHDRGDTQQAANYRQQMIQLADDVGMGIAKDSYETAQIDLLMRNSAFGEAIERCQAAIDSDRPVFSKAGYQTLLASAYSFLRNYDEAHAHGTKAIEMYEAKGDLDSASDTVTLVASNLSSCHSEEKWQEAEDLLQRWIERDKQRQDLAAAINKYEVLIQMDIERYHYATWQSEPSHLLFQAEQLIQSAQALATDLPKRSAAKQQGSLLQLRGQVCQARGDEDGVIQAWRDALALYEEAGLAMSIANCQFILGVIFLNRANRSFQDNFPASESNLQKALEFYASTAMRSQSADTRYMIARLYTNATAQVKGELRDQLLDASLEQLEQGELEYDAARREFTVGDSVLEVQRGKGSFIEKSQRIYELALEIHSLLRPNPPEAWSWAQQAKARGLSDVLGLGSIPPTRLISQLADQPASLALLLRERELVSRIQKVSPEEKIGLRDALDQLWQEMKQDDHLADYLELRSATALDATELSNLIRQQTSREQPIVCLDWIAVNGQLLLLALRADQPAQLFPLALRQPAVSQFIDSHLSAEAFRSTLRDTPEVLRELDPLIAPLADIAAPEELLIFSPTGPLHGLPLHALELKGQTLLERHPIVYCPSLSVLRHCLSRRRQRQQPPVVGLFGDPNGDRPAAAALVRELERHFGTTALVNGAVTRKAVSEALRRCELVHFQGHAIHLPQTPLDSHLALATHPDTGHADRLTAQDIFTHHELQAELVTLAACESAANVIETGDEPFGLIPAFLYAGANAVLATLWKVNQTSAAETMRHFYHAFTGSDPPMSKARALRQAMLTVRETPGCETPYHWAPFVLYGDWS